MDFATFRYVCNKLATCLHISEELGGGGGRGERGRREAREGIWKIAIGRNRGKWANMGPQDAGRYSCSTQNYIFPCHSICLSNFRNGKISTLEIPAIMHITSSKLLFIRRKQHVSLFPPPFSLKNMSFFFIFSISQNVKVGIIFVQCRDTFPNVKLLLLCLICHISNIHRYNQRNFCMRLKVPGTYDICYSHACIQCILYVLYMRHN